MFDLFLDFRTLLCVILSLALGVETIWLIHLTHYGQEKWGVFLTKFKRFSKQIWAIKVPIGKGFMQVGWAPNTGDGLEASMESIKREGYRGIGVGVGLARALKFIQIKFIKYPKQPTNHHPY
jgi:hypothetical protein